MKTIKQIADEIGVSKDKVKYQVGKLPENYLVKKNNITYIKNEGIQRIKEIISKNYPSNPQVKNKENSYFYPPLIDVLQETILTLQQQLNIKDEQIEILQTEIEKERNYSREQANKIVQLADQSQQLQLNIQKQLPQQKQEIKEEVISKPDNEIIKNKEKSNDDKKDIRKFLKGIFIKGCN